MTVKARKLAIFDIDGTIFRSSLLIELVETLVQEKIFSPNASKIYRPAQKQWFDRKGEYEDYISAVVKSFEKNLKGVDYSDFLKVAKRVVTNNKDRVYRFTRDLIKQLKRENYYLLAISNSPREVVKEFCKNLGFDKIYGRLYEVDKRNRFNGKLVFADLMNDKAKVLRRVVEKEGLALKGSVGVGDTEGDIKFLELVDQPICFNPNKKLFNHARRMKWAVVVERKDVIYKL